jgi:U5 small nuclear ribonucleoprotein component
MSEDSEKLRDTLAELHITLRASAYKMDTRPLLKVVLEAFFGPSTGLVDMITEFIPSPVDAAPTKISKAYTGPLQGSLVDSMLKCSADGPTVVHVTKLFHTSDAQSFRAFGRVMSGTVEVGQRVKVLGEGYSLEDEEDMAMATVEALMLDESRSDLHFISVVIKRLIQQIHSRYPESRRR